MCSRHVWVAPVYLAGHRRNTNGVSFLEAKTSTGIISLGSGSRDLLVFWNTFRKSVPVLSAYGSGFSCFICHTTVDEDANFGQKGRIMTRTRNQDPDSALGISCIHQSCASTLSDLGRNNHSSILGRFSGSHWSPHPRRR